MLVCAFEIYHIFLSIKILLLSLLDSDCEKAQSLFDTIRPVVIHITRSHKQVNLTRRLQLYCKTRWNSVHSMFFTFNENFSDLRMLLDQNHQQLFDTIDQELLRQLIPFLKLFVEITELLSNEQQPTLHLVLPCRQKLIQVSKSSSTNEHPGLRELKNYFIEHLEDDWPVQDEHYVATVLHPQFKQLDIFSKKIRRYAHDLVKDRLSNDSTISSSSSSTTISSSTTTPLLSSSINCPDQGGLLSSLYDKPKDFNKKKSEFEIYLNSDLRLGETEDLLQFWMQQRENYPQLFQLAKQVLIIPASNTCVERMFSTSGATVTEKRTRLAVDKIDKMIFLNKNLVYLKSLRELNQKNLSEDSTDALFSSNKRSLSTDILQSPLQAKRTRMSRDDEATFSNRYEQIQLDDDEDDEDCDHDDEDLF